MIDTIMLFAAGLGNRMRHLTENNPKTLIPILGKPILHHGFDLCSSYPFKKVVINTHYMHQQIEESIAEYKKINPNFPEIIIIYEKELLETGGAVKNAQAILGDQPIFALNTDIVLQSKNNMFHHLLTSWDETKMDFLLLMQPFNQAVGYSGHGDFELNCDGRLSRPDIERHYQYMFAGLQILNPACIAKNPLKIFSLREYYLNSERVFGVESKDARWYHATTPENIIDIEMDMLAHEQQNSMFTI